MAGSIDLLLHGGKVVAPTGVIDADIAVSEGRIEAITRSAKFEASMRIDVHGKFVMPGVIDPHVHIFSEGGSRTFNENCELETPSMVSGGVTTSLGFVRSLEPYDSLLPEMIATIPKHSMVDMGLHLVINNAVQLNAIPEYYRNYGIKSFKLFMGEKDVKIFPGTTTVDDAFLYEALGKISTLGRDSVAMVHAENWNLANFLKTTLQQKGRSDQQAWTESRPGFGEEEAVYRAALFAREQACRLYIVHVSSPRTLGALRWAAGEGVVVQSEVTPHHLLLTMHDSSPHPLKFTPPLRDRSDCDTLWSALKAGEIGCVGSDHISGKNRADLPSSDNIWAGGSGYAGSATILPLLISEGYHKRSLSIERICELTSKNPAKFFSFYPRKGCLAVGSDADIVVVDPNLERVLSPEVLHLASDFTPFDGWKVKGWPVLTVLRGEVQMQDGQVTGKPMGAYLGRNLEVLR